MKKHFCNTASFIISFIAAFFVFLLAIAIVIGIKNPTLGIPPVLFMESDKTLNIFGEAVVIPGETVKKILSYPGCAGNFALSFFPQTIRKSIVFFAEQISSHCSEFVSGTATSIKDFLTVGM